MNTGELTVSQYKNKGFSSQLFNLTIGSRQIGSFLIVQEGFNIFKWSELIRKR